MKKDNIVEKAENLLAKQLNILENGKATEKETAIMVINAVSEMLKVIQ